MARIDQSDDWRDRHAPTISAFESLAMEAYSHLPDEFRQLTTNLTIEIEDFPDDDVFEDMALETPFDLLGPRSPFTPAVRPTARGICENQLQGRAARRRQ